VLVTGSSTASADDPRNVSRILAVHKELEGSPLRIRSILTWPSEGLRASADPQTDLAEWLNTIRTKDLASIVEFESAPRQLAPVRGAAQFAIQRGFTVRLRSEGPLDRETVDLALECGAIALHGSPASAQSLLGELAPTCVFVAPGSELIEYDPGKTQTVRAAIDSGLAFALSSAFHGGGPGTLNTQFILHLACSRLKLTPEQAITAATHNAAAALRFADSAGSLAPGRPADLLVMDVPDFRDIPMRAGHHDAWIVVRAGRVIYRKPALTLD
jgi:imidazolonepropionase